MLKSNAFSKVRGSTRVNHQQITFELKQQVLCALNKLADRDTYQIGVEFLSKTIENLKPDGISPFLSCIVDTDSEQKSAVRKECIKLMGMLVNYHEDLMGPHLGKMVSSIVKRLKDPDSIVKDASVETFGVLASKLGNNVESNEGAFVALVKPLFEALGEQNKHVQSGAALCLAQIIDCTSDPPASILQKMLAKTIKFLKTPHFMAKPAVIELNRSIIQAGGAPTRNLLSTAIGSIQDSLKNSDWNTRKAAAIALGNIASNGGSFRSSFKLSCIRTLESCRFDKVKPVREIILHSLHLWKTLPSPDAPELSESGSSVKDSYFGGDNGDVCSSIEFGSKDGSFRNTGTSSIKNSLLLSSRKTCQDNAIQNPRHPKGNDWNIEIAVPQAQKISLADSPSEESEGSSVNKTFGRVSSDITSTLDNGFEFTSVDDGQDTSSISYNVSDNYETKFVTVSEDRYKGVGPIKQIVSNHNNSEEQRYSVNMQDRRSLDSTVTQLSPQTVRECCSQRADEMASIRKQLLEIENNQSNLMDLFKMFTKTTTESLSLIQSKVSSLEQVVDQIAQGIDYNGRNYDLAAAKLLMKSPSIASPRHSFCTPRSSLDMRTRKPSTLSTKNGDIWEENTLSSTQSSLSSVTNKPSRKTSIKVYPQAHTRTDIPNSIWKLVKSYLLEGDIDSAYAEAVHSGDEHLLFELVDRTGPVLESLSQKTATDVLSTLALFFLEQRFINLIIPWLQQVVDLSTIHGPTCIVLPAKVKREFLLAIQEAAKLCFSNPADRRSVMQLATKLHQIWAKVQVVAMQVGPFLKMHLLHEHEKLEHLFGDLKKRENDPRIIITFTTTPRICRSA